MKAAFKVLGSLVVLFVSISLSGQYLVLDTVLNMNSSSASITKILISDLDGDGAFELLIGRNNSNMEVMTDLELGGYSEYSLTAEVPFDSEIFSGDYNGDGYPDIGWSTGSNVGWALNDGVGNISNPDTAYLWLGQFCYSYDIDSNGLDDLILTSGDGSIYWVSGTTGVIGEPQLLVENEDNLVQVNELCFGDFDGDNDIDMAQAIMVGFYGFSIRYFMNSSMQFNQSSVVLPFTNSYDDVGDIEAMDIDQDGDLDLLLTLEYDLVVFEKISPLMFNGVSTVQQDVGNAFDLELSDINSDGLQDILFGTDFHQFGLLDNLGNSNFSTPEYLANNQYEPVSIASGDIDFDGDIDAIVAIGDAKKILVYRNQSTPSSIDEQFFSYSSAYPNPFVEYTSIQLPGIKGEVNTSLFSLNGDLVRQSIELIEDGILVYGRNGIINGVYFLLIEQKENRHGVRLLIH